MGGAPGSQVVNPRYCELAGKGCSNDVHNDKLVHSRCHHALPKFVDPARCHDSSLGNGCVSPEVTCVPAGSAAVATSRHENCTR